ncbi:hornerin-like isoform X2 [Littorina saxatilis]|uniref:CUB domain-containing protein n=1 Tax=Littorina saxatilis TaxID=31220 RepID=A0AAN9BYY2_9CAEN
MMFLCKLGLAAVFLTGLACVVGQGYRHQSEINLCDKRPGYEPNGEHLGAAGDNLTVHVNWTITDHSVQHRCLMRFSTCDSCRLHVQALSSFNYPSCPSLKVYQEYDGWCVPGCSYLHLYDKNYSNRTAESYTSSSSNSANDIRVLNFRTQSKYIYVVACANKTQDTHVVFHLKITAEDKTETFTGTSADIGRPHFFSSPFFPDEYALDSDVYKYVFQAATQEEFITISFDDWQLSQHSSIRFDNANIKGEISGSNYRPWIISDSHKLEMTFQTGPYKIPGTFRSFKGFRATYTFHSKGRDDVPFVHTNCGQSVTDEESGTIEFNPTANGVDYHDCIWVIKKNPSFERVMIKVRNYTTRARDTTYQSNAPNLLEIRNGLTSRGTLVESALPSTSPGEKLTFRAHDSDEGFYVRIKGHYYGRKDFVLTYTSFNIDNCKRLFKCGNGRCVPSHVTCNGIDNCGDNSDESYYAGCGSGSTSGGSKSSSPITVSIIIPLVVSVFLIVVICLLILFIRRCRRLSCQARRAHRHQQQVDTVSGSVSRGHRRHRRRGERRDADGIPRDPPPSYEDVLSNTPIGYLNLGFADASYHPAGPIQPPSYEEAISPTTENPAFCFQGNGSHDLSTDSSSPDTIGRSQANLSTSYSSDETHPSGNRHRHRRRTVSVSSSDSSTDGVMVEEQNSDDGGSQNNRERNQQMQVGPPNSRNSIAKPDDVGIELPVTSSNNIARKKNSKSNKLRNRQKNDSDGLLISLPSEGETAPPSVPQSREGISEQRTTSRLEASPLIISPASLLSASTRQGHATSAEGQGEGRASSMDISHAARSRSQTNLTGDPASHLPLSENNPNTLEDQTSARRDGYNRTSPSKNVPPHIRKAKGSSSGLMKHLSKSMDNIDRRTEDGEFDSERAQLSNRQYSRSVQNIADAACGRGQGDDDNPNTAFLQRGVAHHQSQPVWSRDDGPDEGRAVLGKENRKRGTQNPAGSTGDRGHSRSRSHTDQEGQARSHHEAGDSRYDRVRAEQQQSRHYPERQEGHPKAQSLPRERNFNAHPRDTTMLDPRGRREPEPRSRAAEQRREQDLNPRPGERRDIHPDQSRSPPRYNPRPGHGEAPAAQHNQHHPYSHSLERQRVSQEEHYKEQSRLQGRQPPAGHGEYRKWDRPGDHPKKDQPTRPRAPPYPDQGTRSYPDTGQGPHSPSRGQPPSSLNGTPDPPPYRPRDSSRAERPADRLVQPSNPQDDARSSRPSDPRYTGGHSNQNRPLRTSQPEGLERIPDTVNQNWHPAPGYPRSERPPKPARTTRPPSTSGPGPGLGVYSAPRNHEGTGQQRGRPHFQEGSRNASTTTSGLKRAPTSPLSPAGSKSTGSPHNPTQNFAPDSAAIFPHAAALSSSPSGGAKPELSPSYPPQHSRKSPHTSNGREGNGDPNSVYRGRSHIPQQNETAKSDTSDLPTVNMNTDMELSTTSARSAPSSETVLPESPIRILPAANGAGNASVLSMQVDGVVEQDDDIYV